MQAMTELEKIEIQQNGLLQDLSTPKYMFLQACHIYYMLKNI